MVNIKNGWVIPAALMLSAGGVSAQKTLEQRVEALESQTSSALSFGSKIELYGFVKADLIYDLDADLGNTFFWSCRSWRRNRANWG